MKFGSGPDYFVKGLIGIRMFIVIVVLNPDQSFDKNQCTK